MDIKKLNEELDKVLNESKELAKGYICKKDDEYYCVMAPSEDDILDNFDDEIFFNSYAEAEDFAYRDGKDWLENEYNIDPDDVLVYKVDPREVEDGLIIVGEYSMLGDRMNSKNNRNNKDSKSGPDYRKRKRGKPKTFVEWFGEDLTGQTYDGDIDCACYNIISLKGSPEKVTGDFICLDNKLTTLEGAPKEVGGDFNCGLNKKLTTLEGAPEKVGGYFSCGYSDLKSLKGVPKEVGGSFNCGCNELTTLEGAPEKVNGNFDCHFNHLTSLKGAPKYVGGDFYCNFNRLTTLEGAPEYVGGDFYCGVNSELSLDGIGEVKGEIRRI